MDPSLFAQYLINGVALGSLYALIAIGYTIIYGVVGLINRRMVSSLWRLLS